MSAPTEKQAAAVSDLGAKLLVVIQGPSSKPEFHDPEVAANGLMIALVGVVRQTADPDLRAHMTREIPRALSGMLAAITGP
jgi:hypothetical protein